MGIDTRILLTPSPGILDVLRYIDDTYKNASLVPFGGDVNAFWINFKDGNDDRRMSVFMPDECASDYADITQQPSLYISMGCWGNSEIIARRLAVKFGGFIMPNDCTDDWQRP